MINEKALIINIKSGDEYSFNELYKLYVSRLYYFVYQFVKSEQVTDDIVQETFLKVWLHRNKLDTEKSFKAYLFTISYHLLIKEIRRQLNNPLLKDFLEYQKDVPIESTSEDNLDYDRFVYALTKAKEKLSTRQRQIFELNKEYNIPIITIAKQLSLNEQTVRNQLSAALKIIRTELKQYDYILLLFFINF